MSELVEKVARAMCTAYGSDPDEWWESHRSEARAAIRAVAEWLGKEHGHTGCQSKLLSQLEDRK